MQAEAKDKDLAGSSKSSAMKRAGKRARRLAKEGARSKAVGSLKGGIKQLTRDKQVEWANK
eukprot:9146846-Karenia_brevis.AAC.1